MSAGNARVHLFGWRAFRGAGAVERKVAGLTAQLDEEFVEMTLLGMGYRDNLVELGYGG